MECRRNMKRFYQEVHGVLDFESREHVGDACMHTGMNEDEDGGKHCSFHRHSSRGDHPFGGYACSHSHGMLLGRCHQYYCRCGFVLALNHTTASNVAVRWECCCCPFCKIMSMRLCEKHPFTSTWGKGRSRTGCIHGFH